MAASRAFGQPDLTLNTPNNGGVSAASLNGPTSMALDMLGNLYVADYGNSRLLEYDLPAPHGVPTVAALSPSSVARGSPDLTLTVNGTGFVPGSVVRWNGTNRPTTYLSGAQLNAAISAGDISSGGPFAVTVFTPAPGGGTSNPTNLTLYPRAGHDAAADMEQGQPSLTTNDPNNLFMPAGNGLNYPRGVAVVANSGRLFVADAGNNRVLSWPNAAALMNAQPADLVLGQPNFVANAPNNGGLSASSLYSPQSAALDAQGNLYATDHENNRVLEYGAPLRSGMAASRVFGQSDFTHNTYNNGGISADSLSYAFGMAVDADGNLYVADEFNNRVLEYDAPLTYDSTADRVFGQPSFITNTTNNGGIIAHSLHFPVGVAVDKQGNLYVADYGNDRVLEYDMPLAHDTTADRVFGQPDFSSKTVNNGSLSADSLYGPSGVALDAFGNLYVADEFNNRVLDYNAPLTHDAGADGVFGQPTFYLNNPNQGGNPSADSLYGPWGVALDAQNNLYVADSFNFRVLEYDWALDRLALPLVRR